MDRIRVSVNEILRTKIDAAVFDKNLPLYTHNRNAAKDSRIYIDLDKSWSDLRLRRVANLVASHIMVVAPTTGKIVVSNRDNKMKINGKVYSYIFNRIIVVEFQESTQCYLLFLSKN